MLVTAATRPSTAGWRSLGRSRGGHFAWDTDPQNGTPDGVALVDTATGTLLDALAYEGGIGRR